MAEIDFSRIGELIIKHYNHDLSVEEEIELNHWLNLSEDNYRLLERFGDAGYVRQQLQRLRNSDKKTAWAKILETISEARVIEMPALVPARARWRRIALAASLIGVIAVGAWIWIKNQPGGRTITAAISSKFGSDVRPGSDKAVLTLADGSTILLAAAGKGTIARQGNTKIEKIDSGRLFYNALDEQPGAMAYNTLATPPAGQFQVILPDGTKVWLNNASSLRYPTSFRGKSREVELKGEAYFEVAPDPALPFKVKVNDLAVDVLGTSFNIMAYADETSVKTTLLSGGVRIIDGNNNISLKPGEQAQIGPIGVIISKDVDTDGVIAWKNGLFHFERADLKSVMRVLARWYDVEVVYEGTVTDHLYGGDIQRNLNLSQVLDILQRNQVHFSIDNRKITVRP